MRNRVKNLMIFPTKIANSGDVARPASMDEFIGQDHLKALIRTAVVSAKQRNAPFPHTLITGAAGLGKTSIARLIATEMGAKFVGTTADILEDAYDAKGMISQLDDAGYDNQGQPNGKINPSILFIDEAHRLPRASQELMYACVEDRVLDIRVRDPISGLVKPIREWVPHFTLIAATNRPGDLTPSFRDRLRLNLRLESYDTKDSIRIARQTLLLIPVPKYEGQLWR